MYATGTTPPGPPWSPTTIVPERLKWRSDICLRARRAEIFQRAYCFKFKMFQDVQWGSNLLHLIRLMMSSQNSPWLKLIGSGCKWPMCEVLPRGVILVSKALLGARHQWFRIFSHNKCLSKVSREAHTHTSYNHVR